MLPSVWLASLLDTSDLFHFSVTRVTSRELPENIQYSVLQGLKGIMSFPVKILSLPSKDSATIKVPESVLAER